MPQVPLMRRPRSLHPLDGRVHLTDLVGSGPAGLVLDAQQRIVGPGQAKHCQDRAALARWTKVRDAQRVQLFKAHWLRPRSRQLYVALCNLLVDQNL